MRNTLLGPDARWALGVKATARSGVWGNGGIVPPSQRAETLCQETSVPSSLPGSV